MLKLKKVYFETNLIHIIFFRIFIRITATVTKFGNSPSIFILRKFDIPSFLKSTWVWKSEKIGHAQSETFHEYT